MSLVDATLVDAPGGGYVNCTGSSGHSNKIKPVTLFVKCTSAILVATICISPLDRIPFGSEACARKRAKKKGKYGLMNVPLGNHKLDAVQMSRLVGREVEDSPGDVFWRREPIGG